MRKKTNTADRRRKRVTPRREVDIHRNTIRQVDGVTDNQKKYIKSILDNIITVCVGPAGSGKSYIAAGMLADLLQSGEYKQIIATRPLV